MNKNAIIKKRNFYNTRNAFFYTFLTLNCFFGGALQAQPFDKTKDILIAQFDNKEDADDIHSQAGLACILAHPDAKDVKFFAVAGAYGKQPGEFVDSRSLFYMAFGVENGLWTDAHKDRVTSVIRIKDKVKPILLAGGKAWVQEAGQSDVTLLWINALLTDGVPAATVKSNVIIVQHSRWNENQASAGVLDTVKLKATYIKIEDGNSVNATPGYKSSDKTFMIEVLSSANKNSLARDVWTEADKIIKASGFNASYSTIPGGGVDFSDDVEVWHILGLGNNAFSIRNFWDRYVVNVP